MQVRSVSREHSWVRADIPEFELVTQALWTDPNDQSGWLYHRWLIGAAPPEDVLRKEVKNIRELHETEPDSNCELGPFRNVEPS